MRFPKPILLIVASLLGLVIVAATLVILLFDPNDFRDRATYGDPHRFPTGTRTTVLINGTVVVRDTVHTGALPGQVLRRDADGRVQ